MKKLFVGFSFAAMALLAACGGDSGSSADNLDESSSSVEMEGIESSDSEDLNSNGSEGSEGESSGSEDAESSGSGVGNSSGGSEEPESSGSEGVEGSSASVPGGSSDASTYDMVTGTLTDSRDGQTYKTVKIGDQMWMAENLNFETVNSWCGGGSGTIEGNCSVYGRLYTWAAAVGRDEDKCGYGYTCGLGSGDVRGICPEGWHLPSNDEWDALFTAVGGSSTEGTKLKSRTGWYSNGNGTDAFGFSALPAGLRDNDGNFGSEGDYAYFWSSTEVSSYLVFNKYLGYEFDSAYLGNYRKNYGLSVRCLED